MVDRGVRVQRALGRGDHRAQLGVGPSAANAVTKGRRPEHSADHVMVRGDSVDVVIDRAATHGATIEHGPVDYPYGERQVDIRDHTGRSRLGVVTRLSAGAGWTPWERHPIGRRRLNSGNPLRLCSTPARRTAMARAPCGIERDENERDGHRTHGDDVAAGDERRRSCRCDAVRAQRNRRRRPPGTPR